MKIAIVVPDASTVGGAETVARNLRTLFSDMGHKASLVSAFTMSGSFADMHLGIKKPRSYISRIRTAFALRSGDLQKYDLIIGNNFFRYYASKITGAHCVELLHLSYYEDDVKRRSVFRTAQRTLRNLLLSKLDAIVCLTRRDAEYYRRAGLEKVEVCPNFVFLPNVITRHKEQLVVCCGRATEQKNIKDAIDAFQVARRNRSWMDWRLEIYTSGRLYSDIEQRARGVDGIHVYPLTRDMPKLLDRASILLLPSLYEGFPMILLEAMARGVVPISYDCDAGPSEIIEPDHSGILVALGDSDAMGRRLAELIASRDSLREAEKNSRDRARTFDHRAAKQRWAEVIGNVLK